MHKDHDLAFVAMYKALGGAPLDAPRMSVGRDGLQQQAEVLRGGE